MSYVTLTDRNGNKFRATAEQAEALESLSVARAGGIATVYGYRPSTGYVSPPVQDMQILTKFSTGNLYRRKIAALNAIAFDDVKAIIADDEKLSVLSESDALELFTTRKAAEIASMEKTLEGDRSDAHRAAHDRNYADVADGLKVNFVTEKVDGLQIPVLTDGLPTVASIMVHYLELNRTVRVKGERKVVNSGAPVRMSNAIATVLNSRSVGLRTLSLKESNFDRLIVDRKSYIAEDVVGIPLDLLVD